MSSAKVSGSGTGASPARAPAVESGCTLTCAEPSSSRSRVARRSRRGAGCVGGHRGNDSQRPEPRARWRPGWMPTAASPAESGHERRRVRARPPDGGGRREPARRDPATGSPRPPGRTARRPRSSPRVRGRRAAAPTAPGPPTTAKRGPAATRSPSSSAATATPVGVDALGQLAPEGQPAARHLEARRREGARRRAATSASRDARRSSRRSAVSPGASRISSSRTSCSSTGAPRSVVTRASTSAGRRRPRSAHPARCAGRPSATSRSCPR